MAPVDPIRLRRSQQEAKRQLSVAWLVAGGFLLLALVVLLVTK